jgi:hypothetical protein
MRKIVLVSAVVLALMLVTLVPMPARSEAAPEVRSLPFNALPVKEEFAEAVDLDAVAGEVADPTPFWVDIVDAEGYDGGEGDIRGGVGHRTIVIMAKLLYQSCDW